MNKSQRGFTIVETLLVVLIVVVVGFGSYYVWHTHHKNTPAAVNSSSTKKPISKSQSQPVPAQKFLDIKEWAVKLPISGVTSDAYYKISTSSQDNKGQPNTMWLGVHSLDSEPGCNASTANEGRGVSIGALVRAAPGETDPVTGDVFDQSNPHGTKVGTYYYSVLLAQAPCNQDPKNDSLLTSVRNAFTSAGLKIAQD